MQTIEAAQEFVPQETPAQAHHRGVQEGIRQERERVLGRLRQAIADWRRPRTQSDPSAEVCEWVVIVLDCFSSCLTHAGVTKEQAIAEAMGRLHR